jgi:putative membrane protein
VDPGPAAASDHPWERFHPLSPLLRGGVTLLAVAAWVIGNQVDALFGQRSDVPTGAPLQWLALGAALVVLMVVLLGWLSWRVSRFRVGESTLEVRTGLVFRQHRQVRYDRIQAVDIRRPLLARLAGLSEVRVQAAGGSGSDARLAFLHQAQAHDVRARLMALAGRSDEANADHGAPPSGPEGGGAVGGASAAGGGAPAAGGAGAGDRPGVSPARLQQAGGVVGASAEETVVRVPTARLVQATLYRGQTLFLVVAVPTLVTAMALGRGGMVAFLGPAVLAVGGNTVGSLVKEWNFELVRDRGGIQVRRGLTDLKASSVPVHRIQVVSLRQPMFWRLPDWWRVEVNVAGVGPSADDSDSVVLPVGTRAEALRIVTLLRPGADPRAVLEGMVGAEPGPAAYVVAPQRAVWLSPLVRVRHGYAVTPDAVLVRGGRARRFTHLVPHARIQSLRVRQGPLQRRLRLASVELLSTPGRARPQVTHLDQSDAELLLNGQVARSSVARRRAR